MQRLGIIFYISSLWAGRSINIILAILLNTNKKLITDIFCFCGTTYWSVGRLASLYLLPVKYRCDERSDRRLGLDIRLLDRIE